MPKYLVRTVDILGTINNDTVTVNDINDDTCLAAVGAVGDEAESTCFNETFKHVLTRN